MRESTETSLTNKIEINTSSTEEPIIKTMQPGKKQRPQTCGESTQHTFRRMGRFFTPIADSAMYLLFYNFIADLSGLYKLSEEKKQLTVAIATGLFLASIPTLTYEIYNNLRLSRNSIFSYGDSDIKQLNALHKHVSLLLNKNISDYKLTELLKFLDSLETKQIPELVYLINDFKRVRRYNYARKYLDNLQASILAIIIFTQVFAVRCRLGGYTEKNPESYLPAIAISTLLFLFKGSMNYIEHNWESYQLKWQRLSSKAKKAFLALKNTIDVFYDLTFASGALGLALTPIGYIMNANTLHNYSLASNLFANDLFGCTIDTDSLHNLQSIISSNAILAAPLALIYTAIEWIPSHTPRFDKASVHTLKKANQGIFQFIKVGGGIAVITVFMIASLDKFISSNSEDSNAIGFISFIITFLVALLLSPIGGITSGFNRVMNYQERDTQKFNIYDNDLAALKYEIAVTENESLSSANNSMTFSPREEMRNTHAPLIASKSPKKETPWYAFLGKNPQTASSAIQIDDEAAQEDTPFLKAPDRP